jgi:hypothetical protein
LEKPIYPGAPLPEAPPAEVPVRETAPLDATAENKPYAGESARGRTLGGIPKRVAAPVASSPVPEPGPAVQAMPSPAANLPAPYQPFARPSVVPSTQNIRENMGMVADAEAQPNRITPDSREDNAIAQEMNWDLEKHGWRAMSEARRAAIAGSSTGVTKGDLAQVAKNLTSGTPGGPATGTAVDDLTEILRKSLEKVKQKQAQQGQ